MDPVYLIAAAVAGTLYFDPLGSYLPAPTAISLALEGAATGYLVPTIMEATGKSKFPELGFARLFAVAGGIAGLAGGFLAPGDPMMRALIGGAAFFITPKLMNSI
jgi:hypothetical protein